MNRIKEPESEAVSIPPEPAHWIEERDCYVCWGSGKSGEPLDIVEGIGCWNCRGKGYTTETVWEDEEWDDEDEP